MAGKKSSCPAGEAQPSWCPEPTSGWPWGHQAIREAILDGPAPHTAMCRAQDVSRWGLMLKHRQEGQRSLCERKSTS